MDKRTQSETTNNSAESIVGPSVKIEGDLKSQGNLRIDGTVTGKVKTSQNLFIGDTANISADIEAENAVISGVVQGNVKIVSALVLTGTGRVTGDILCGTLQVEEGAYFLGKCQMKDKISNTHPEPQPEK